MLACSEVFEINLIIITILNQQTNQKTRSILLRNTSEFARQRTTSHRTTRRGWAGNGMVSYSNRQNLKAWGLFKRGMASILVRVFLFCFFFCRSRSRVCCGVCVGVWCSDDARGGAAPLLKINPTAVGLGIIGFQYEQRAGTG
jgi:hypothetical protein